MESDLVEILVEDGVEECLDSGLVFESGRVSGKGEQKGVGEAGSSFRIVHHSSLVLNET